MRGAGGLIGAEGLGLLEGRYQPLHQFAALPADGYEASMAEVIMERVRRYILDGTDEDLWRLLSISEISAETQPPCRIGACRRAASWLVGSCAD